MSAGRDRERDYHGWRGRESRRIDIFGGNQYLHPMSKRALVSSSSPLTPAEPGVKLHPMGKRVLLEPATVSPKRALIQAAVEKVVAERKRRETEERAAARKARVSRRSEPAHET
jgi:hypothetical protein